MATKRSGLRARQHATRDERVAQKALATTDSFQNFAARLGVGTGNIAEQATYGFNPISRVRTLLEWMYRGSWICGVAVDSVADDMTRAGIDYLGTLPPEQTEALDKALLRYQIWPQLNDLVKWARLYGGCIAVMMIEGQKAETPLRLNTVGPEQFQGLLVMDRWMVEPSLEDLVTDTASPDLGLPKFYRVTADAPALPRMTVHHSRVIRLEGVRLPYWQRISENLWGMSVLERLYDRLIAFDSTTQGTAQLVYRAHLRTIKIPQLRDIVAKGGPAFEGLAKQLNFTRQYQSLEGLTILDKEDEFEASSYTFSGLDQVLMQFGQQLSGALQIPLVRLFGQSPAGLNSTGESDLRTYYDGVNNQQEKTLRFRLSLLLQVIARSERIPLDKSFNFSFKPLWQMTEPEKADVAGKVADMVDKLESSAIIKRSTALKELRQQSRLTGILTGITDQDIKDAVEQEAAEPPAPLVGAAGAAPEGELGTEGDPAVAEPHVPGVRKPPQRPVLRAVEE